jgi:hypothetical protein
MPINNGDTLTVQLEQLRAILTLLEAAPAGELHDALIERARVTVAAIRQIRDTLARDRRPWGAE